MKTKTFKNPEELMIALLQGEKWEIAEPFAGVCYYDDLDKREPFRFVDDYGDSYINRAYNYCDGKTLWHKVEEKTISLAMFTCYQKIAAAWVDATVCSSLEEFKELFSHNIYINHHEIPNTRYEIEVDDE